MFGSIPGIRKCFPKVAWDSPFSRSDILLFLNWFFLLKILVEIEIKWGLPQCSISVFYIEIFKVLRSFSCKKHQFPILKLTKYDSHVIGRLRLKTLKRCAIYKAILNTGYAFFRLRICNYSTEGIRLSSTEFFWKFWSRLVSSGFCLSVQFR